MWTAVQLAFAGLWPLVFHWGIGVGAIALCLIGAYGTRLIAGVPLVGPWLSTALSPLRHDLLWAAFGIAIFMAGMAIGTHDEANHCVAKTVVIEKRVDNVVKRTATPKAKKQADPWDREDN